MKQAFTKCGCSPCEMVCTAFEQVLYILYYYYYYYYYCRHLSAGIIAYKYNKINSI